MRNIIILLLVFFLNSFLFSQVNFELIFYIENPAQDDVLLNIWIDDLDDNGDDEMYALYTNHYESNWKLFCLDLEGNIEWNHISDYPNDFISLKNGLLFNNNNSTYFAAVFSREVVLEPYTSDIYSDLKIYDWDNQTLVDSTSIYIGTSGDFFGRYFDINHITPIVLNNSLNLYIGEKLTRSWGSWEEGYHNNISNKINRFSFDSNILVLEETIINAGSNLLYYNDYNSLISFCKNSWYYIFMNDWSSGSTEYLKTLSFDIPSQISDIHYSTNSVLKLLTINDLNYSDYGLSVYLSNADSDYRFQCYAPDFSDTLWISHQLGIIDEGCYLTSSTCVSTNLGDNYILNFGDSIEQPNPPKLEIRDRLTGQIILTQHSYIDPDFILRANDNSLFFIEGLGDPYNPAYYYVYKLENEIQVSCENCIIAELISELCNYPNPFNPTTTISFSIPEESNVELSIYNIKGQKIKSLLSDQITAGEHSVVWDGNDSNNKRVSSGIYFYRLETVSKTITKKMLLLK